MLTETQRQVLAHLRGYQERGEPMPTLRDLCSNFSWRSTGTARDHLRALVAKGYLLPARGRARSYRLAEASPPRALCYLPILGRVVAGAPVETEEYHEGNLAVAAERVGQKECFALRVWGDSMKDGGILEDDFVIVEKRCHAEDGDIVVALVEDEATIKRLKKGPGRQMELHPENDAYDVIPLNDREFVLIGVVIGVQRWYR